MIIIGIDPGNSGAIAVRRSNGSMQTQRLATTERDIFDFLMVEADPRFSPDVFAYLEKVHAFPRAGVTGMFHFGQSYGFLRGILIALEIPFEEVLPRKWQTAMQCLSGGDKNVTKARAQQLFPELKITHAIADALLITEYGRRLRSGELSK